METSTPQSAQGEDANLEETEHRDVGTQAEPDATNPAGTSGTAPAAGESPSNTHASDAPKANNNEQNSSQDPLPTPPALPAFPHLAYNPPPPSPAILETQGNTEDGQEEHAPSTFDRSSSPSATLRRNKGAVYEKVGEEGVSRMHKFQLYETATRYYLVGGDVMDRRFRILKIDRTADTGDLSIAEDDIVYTKKEMNQLLDAVDDGNKSSGGLKLKSSTWGLLGFIRFTGSYYMLLITKRSQVAMIGGHYIYQIDGTELVPLTTSSRTKTDSKHGEEARFIGILNNLDLSRYFYFSYSYDITQTLQQNITHERQALSEGKVHPIYHNHNDMFSWNHYLLEPANTVLKNTYDWCLPIVHGFVDQATLSVYGRPVYITLIARRSRYFAGARFLKRGANDLGYVANDVETEQIVSEMLTTSFHAPGPQAFANPNYTSYVQHRGSIPLYWTQENTGVTPKPDIEMNLVDPFYSAAALHFDDLFKRYGAPIYVLNLIKARERTPRESKLLVEFTTAIRYLNQFLPSDKQIIYKAWDMSRASKSRNEDVIATLEDIAEDIIPRTGIFQNGVDEQSGLRVQNGVARTNCIDCLDRTNAAQFVVGKRALGHQLHALGVIDGTSIEYDSDAVNLFTHMYHDHGDTIAVQYGGSHLVNTMETYRKINQWTSHSRDMVESFKRYYNNSFLDAQRQEAYNLFLGNYIFAQGQPMLWDLSTDYYLHHADPREWLGKPRKSYVNWYTPEFLRPRELPPSPRLTGELVKKPLDFVDDYWSEYYRPLAVSSFLKIFSFKMNSTLRYLPFKSTESGHYDLSPFMVRTGHESAEHPAKQETKPRKGVKILDPAENHSNESLAPASALRSSNMQDWLQPERPTSRSSAHNGIIKHPHFSDLPLPEINLPLLPQTDPPPSDDPPSKALIAQWTLGQLVTDSLNPSVKEDELKEYERYVSHPLKLPLVVSSDISGEEDGREDFAGYVDMGKPSSGVLEEMVSEETMADFEEFLTVAENPLNVGEDDAPKKRYKRYRQWLKGKSLFKQRVDPMS